MIKTFSLSSLLTRLPLGSPLTRLPLGSPLTRLPLGSPLTRVPFRRFSSQQEDRLKTVYLQQMQMIQDQKQHVDSPCFSGSLLYQYLFRFDRLDRQLNLIQMNSFLFGLSTCVTLSFAPIYSFLPALGCLYCIQKYSRLSGFKNNCIQEIHLIQKHPQPTLKLISLGDRTIECNLDDLAINDISLLQDPRHTRPEEQEGVAPFFISLDVDAQDGTKYKDLRVVIEPEHLLIPNYKLFHVVLWSDLQHLSLFSFEQQ